MTEGYVLTLFKETMTLGLSLAAPVLGVSLVIGLVVSIVQALTQVHEMTLTFVPKVLGVGLALAFLGSWMLQRLLEFTRSLLGNIAVFAP